MIVSVTVMLIVILVVVFMVISGSRGSTDNVIHVEPSSRIPNTRKTTNTQTIPLNTLSETQTQPSSTTLTKACEPLFYLSGIYFNDAELSVDLDLRANVDIGCVVFINKVFLVKIDGGLNKTLLDETTQVGGGQAQFVPLSILFSGDDYDSYYDFKSNYSEKYVLVVIYTIPTQEERTVSVVFRTGEMSPVL